MRTEYERIIKLKFKVRNHRWIVERIVYTFKEEYNIFDIELR